MIVFDAEYSRYAHSRVFLIVSILEHLTFWHNADVKVVVFGIDDAFVILFIDMTIETDRREANYKKRLEKSGNLDGIGTENPEKMCVFMGLGRLKFISLTEIQNHLQKLIFHNITSFPHLLGALYLQHISYCMVILYTVFIPKSRKTGKFSFLHK